MRNIITYPITRSDLLKTTAVAATTALAMSAAPVFGEAQKGAESQATEDMAAYEKNDYRAQANNDIFWLTADEFIGRDVVTAKGKTLGTVEKIVIDPRENRGEAVVSQGEGGMFVLPLDRFWLNNDQVAVAWSLSPKDLEYLTSVYETESGEGYWQDAPAGDTLLGTLVYTGNNDYIERMVKKQSQQ